MYSSSVVARITGLSVQQPAVGAGGAGGWRLGLGLGGGWGLGLGLGAGAVAGALIMAVVSPQHGHIKPL